MMPENSHFLISESNLGEFPFNVQKATVHIMPCWPGKTLRLGNVRAAYSHWFGLLPVREQVGGAALHGAVLLDDLHLQVGHLLLDGGVLALHDVAEGPPLALDVVNVEPRGRELEALLLQQTLPVAEQLGDGTESDH